MPAYYLEIAVVALGLILLVAESFLGKTDRRALGWAAIAGLAGIFAFVFFAKGEPAAAESLGFWSFYTADPLALFYKAIALLTTMAVIFMSIGYTPVLEEYIDDSSKQGGLGEFFYLPVFVCAGLMWMASATDLTSIFVSLEAVAISFYVLVAFLRRNIGSLEAGVKYLILGALSTGFLVYGITWIFGLTGETNLDLIAKVLTTVSPEGRGVYLFAFALVIVGLGFKV